MIRIIGALSVLLLVSCSEAPFYEEFFSVDDGQWAYGEPASFSFEINSLEQKYDLVLDVEHSVDYTYENVYVKIHTTFPSGEKVEDVVSLQLADELDQWQGRCSGNDCRVSILLQSSVRFQEAGRHEITVEQHNREEVLSGIRGLTLKILEVTERD